MFVPQRSAFPFWNMQVFAWILQPLTLWEVPQTAWGQIHFHSEAESRNSCGNCSSLSLSVFLKPSVPPKHTPLGLPQLICLDVSKFWAENTFCTFYLSQLHKGFRIYSKFYHSFCAVISDLYTNQSFQQTYTHVAPLCKQVWCSKMSEKKPRQPSTAYIHTYAPSSGTPTLTGTLTLKIVNSQRKTTLPITQVEIHGI